MPILNLKHEEIPEWLQVEDVYEELPKQEVVVEEQPSGSWDILIKEDGEVVSREVGFTQKEQAIRVAKLFSPTGEVLIKKARKEAKVSLHPGVRAFVDGQPVTVLEVEGDDVTVIFPDGRKEIVSSAELENVFEDSPDIYRETPFRAESPAELGGPKTKTEDENIAVETGRGQGPEPRKMEVDHCAREERQED